MARSLPADQLPKGMEVPMEETRPKRKATRLSLRDRNYMAEIIAALESLPFAVAVMQFDVSEEGKDYPHVNLSLYVLGEKEGDGE